MLVKNGETFRQEGDTLDAIGGASVFTSFGSGPLEISDSGDVLWYGDWDDANTDIDTGLFLNEELLVQEGTRGYPRTCLRSNMVHPRWRNPWNMVVDFSHLIHSLRKF
ncbi:MAG: hypothetical protein IID37_07810 [Planctomycetes bacterium]|nr:hypothetical protein [Planctomycetota bacterium]